MRSQNPLTLIVATTPIRTGDSVRLGIGLNGTLPWPRIKADMTFFARVTSRPPHPGTTNAIIMGRKTYDSLPKTLRPLAKRISAVVTRDASGSVRDGVRKDLEGKRKKAAEKAAAAQEAGTEPAKQNGDEPTTDAVVCSSLENSLETLEEKFGVEGKLGKLFVIGGGEIYTAAMRLGERGSTDRRVRIVMTHVRRNDGKEYECDTFFPVSEFTPATGWREASAGEVSEWVGEEVKSEWRDEGEVSIHMVGYERLS